jgi:hypothetical protein
VTLLMFPLLVLMPLLHAHPLDATPVDHPAGIHLPSAGQALQADVRLPAGIGERIPPADRRSLPTIVVQEERLPAGGRDGAAERTAFIVALRGPTTVSPARSKPVALAGFDWPQPPVHDYRAQAPPTGYAAAA